MRKKITLYLFELKALKFISENNKRKYEFIRSSFDALWNISFGYLKFNTRRSANLCINHLCTTAYSIFTESASEKISE